MATNHQSGFAEAIKRPGRFDLLLHVAPPRWEQKVANLKILWVGPGAAEDQKAAQALFNQWIGQNDTLRALLDLFTVGEIKAFFNAFRKGLNLRVALEED